MSPLKSHSGSLLHARAKFTPDLASWKFHPDFEQTKDPGQDDLDMGSHVFYIFGKRP